MITENFLSTKIFTYNPNQTSLKMFSHQKVQPPVLDLTQLTRSPQVVQFPSRLCTGLRLSLRVRIIKVGSCVGTLYLHWKSREGNVLRSLNGASYSYIGSWEKAISYRVWIAQRSRNSLTLIANYKIFSEKVEKISRKFCWYFMNIWKNFKCFVTGVILKKSRSNS